MVGFSSLRRWPPLGRPALSRGIVVLALALVPLPAAAQGAPRPDPAPAPAPAGDAASMLKAAEGLLRVGAARAALDKLEEAAAATREPTLLARIYLAVGLAYHKLGNGPAAGEAFKSALAQDAGIKLSPDEHPPAAVALLEQARRGVRGRLSVTANHADAEVWVDGQKVGNVPFLGHVAPGSRRVEVRTPDGQWRFETRAAVKVDETSAVDAVLRRVQGYLTVSTRPPRARVYVDGEIVGTTPLDRVPVAAGPRRVRIHREGYQAEERQVAVQADQTHRLRLTLSDAPEQQAPLDTRPRVVPLSERVFTLATAGVAGAALLSALGLGLSVQVDADAYARVPGNDTARLDELESSMDRKALAANVMFGVAGGLAAAAVGLYFFEGWWRGRPAAGERRPDPSGGGSGAALRLRPAVGRGAGLVLSGGF